MAFDLVKENIAFILIVPFGKRADDTPTPVSSGHWKERGQRIFVRVAEAPESALPLVQGIEGVAVAQVERDAVIVVPRDAHVDPRPQITRALVNAGLEVLEVRPAANSLEEIFLELTRNAGTPGGAVVEGISNEGELVVASETPNEAESEA